MGSYRLSAECSAVGIRSLETLSWRTTPLWICLLAVLSWTVPAATAEPELRRSAEPTPASADEGSVREVQPPVLYLRGKEGLLQAVLGLRSRISSAS
jgi:hypothetical protein